MKRSRVLIVCIVGGLFLCTSLWGQTGQEIFNQATNEFRNGRFNRAIESFTLLLTNFSAYRGDAYFWIAKSYIANNQIQEGEEFLEIFINDFRDNNNYPEAIYQRGRVRYLLAEYEEAISAFSLYITQFPEDSFVANAYFWTGEALYNLGILDLAESMYLTVVQRYPRSFRLDASVYRLELLKYRRREQELISLLQWTQEGSNEIANELQKRNLEYSEAIASYRNRIANLSSQTVRDEIAQLSNTITQLEKDRTNLNLRIRDLEEVIRRQENEMRTMQNNAAVGAISPNRTTTTRIIRSTDADFQERLELLRLKEESITLKEEIINNFERVITEINSNE